jgi:hypothetical protein
MSKQTNFKKRELFCERTFFRLLAWCDFEFFRQAAERFKDKWYPKYGKYQLTYSSPTEPIHWPLLFAVQHDLIDHARALIRAGHPHNQRCSQNQFITSFAPSFEMFQTLIEEGVEFRLNQSSWPDGIPIVPLLSRSKTFLSVTCLEYMMSVAMRPIHQEDAYQIVAFFLRSLITFEQSNGYLCIEHNVLKLITAFVQCVGSRTVHPRIIEHYILDQFSHSKRPLVGIQALLILSHIGITRISDDYFPLAPFIKKLSVQAHSFVDALIEHDALKAEDDDDSTLLDDQ